MLHSIQDYAKKINRTLTIYDCVSILATLAVLLGFLWFIRQKEEALKQEVMYTKSEGSLYEEEKGLPFASKSGKTYTFSWCGGASTIKSSNKIYFKSEEEAKNSGRTLSKLCLK